MQTIEIVIATAILIAIVILIVVYCYRTNIRNSIATIISNSKVQSSTSSIQPDNETGASQGDANTTSTSESVYSFRNPNNLAEAFPQGYPFKPLNAGEGLPPVGSEVIMYVRIRSIQYRIAHTTLGYKIYEHSGLSAGEQVGDIWINVPYVLYGFNPAQHRITTGELKNIPPSAIMNDARQKTRAVNSWRGDMFGVFIFNMDSHACAAVCIDETRMLVFDTSNCTIDSSGQVHNWVQLGMKVDGTIWRRSEGEGRSFTPEWIWTRSIA